MFVALRPPPEVLAALWSLRVAGPGLRATRHGQEHLTLAFLGEVEDPAALIGQLDAVLPSATAPRLRLAGAGRFGGGAVWLGLRGELERLHHLQRSVTAAVERAGLALPSGRWRPHLTVGRGRLPEGLAAYQGPEGCWREVALVRSQLRADGAEHTPLREWMLATPHSGGCATLGSCAP